MFKFLRNQPSPPQSEIPEPTLPAPNAAGPKLDGAQRATRSAIFFHDLIQEELAIATCDDTQRSLGKKVVTEVVPASRFFRAEEYHQRYFEKQGRTACAVTLR